MRRRCVTSTIVADPHFVDPRLAAIYDDLDPDRSDLDLYMFILEEFHARSVLDVGCGTGTLACRLAGLGFQVTGVDPAQASLDVARQKHGSERVSWICGTAEDVPSLACDAVTMTGNVAQVFLRDEDWAATLASVRAALHPSGHLVFETRDPSRRGWEDWNPHDTRSIVDIDGVGQVEYSVELVDVSLPFVSFKSTYRFATDGAVLTSDSTLRFRERDELSASLNDAGYSVCEVRDAPDRPGREFVFIAGPAE